MRLYTWVFHFRAGYSIGEVAKEESVGPLVYKKKFIDWSIDRSVNGFVNRLVCLFGFGHCTVRIFVKIDLVRGENSIEKG